MKAKGVIRRIVQFTAIVVTFAAYCNVQAQGTLTRITFDGPPAFLSGENVRQYQESGVLLTAMTNQSGYSGFSRVLSGAWPHQPYNGTAYIQSWPFGPIIVTLGDGLLFGLFSVDLAERDRITPNSLTVEFIGYLADGSTVTTSFATDGIIGVPGTPDFQTFYFGPEFHSGLTRVAIPPTGASLDNLFVFVPEPGTWALLLLAGGIAGLRLLRRKGL